MKSIRGGTNPRRVRRPSACRGIRTQQDVAAELGITRSAVSWTERNAIRKMRTGLIRLIGGAS